MWFAHASIDALYISASDLSLLSAMFSRIHEKLMVHSDLSKAESWSRLTEEFLNSPLPHIDGTKVWWAEKITHGWCEGWFFNIYINANPWQLFHRWPSASKSFLCVSLLQTDAHYSILSLLLFLSDSPSNTNFVERPRVKEAGELTFHWYLMSLLNRPKNATHPC